MKKIILLFAMVFLFGLVSASVTQNNIIDYGINESDGSLTIVSTLTNTNVIAYNCSTSDCSAGGPVLVGPTNIPGNSIVLTYPTSLSGLAGYGLYFYKDGYVPFEAFANWYGTGTPSDFRPYLTKQRTCAIPLSSLGVSYVGGNIVVNANVGSPIQNAGPLNYVPVALSSQYSVNVQVNLTISGTSGYSEVKTVNIPFSNTAGVSFSNAFGDGTYNISVIAGTNDKCISSSSLTLSSNNFVINAVAPGSISNIQAINRTNSTVSWNWSNPSDSDFNGTLLYLNGNNVVNLSKLNNQYDASALIPNTPYNLTVYSIDTAGNINWTGISNVTSTLPNSIPGDTTAPGSVSGLKNITTTNTSITFEWTNPTDSDFNGTIVYLNGIYNRTLSSGINQTIFGGLNPNTNYTITINTIDLTGNVNGTNVSLSVFTNANTGDTTSPGVTIVSPTNTTYSSSNIVFNVSLNELGVVAFTLDNGITNHSMSSTDNLHFNYSASGLSNGGYVFRVYAADFANNLNYTESKAFTVNSSTPDTTSPGSVTNLRNVSSTNTTISWNWSNPGDLDFNGTIIYVDNVFVIKLASGIQGYTGSGFLANTSHTITINTIDLSGNINGTNVTSSARTLANSGSTNNDDNKDDGKPRNYTITNYGQEKTNNKIIYGTSDDSRTIFLDSKEKTGEFNWWPWIIFFLILEIIMVLLLIFIASRKKKKKN